MSRSCCSSTPIRGSCGGRGGGAFLVAAKEDAVSAIKPAPASKMEIRTGCINTPDNSLGKFIPPAFIEPDATIILLNLYLVNRDYDVSINRWEAGKMRVDYKAPDRRNCCAAVARFRDSRISAVASRAASRALRMAQTVSSKQSSHLR